MTEMLLVIVTFCSGIQNGDYYTNRQKNIKGCTRQVLECVNPGTNTYSPSKLKECLVK